LTAGADKYPVFSLQVQNGLARYGI
jgi:hypothetical protein